MISTSGTDIAWDNYQEHWGLDTPSWKGSQDLSITWLMRPGLICICSEIHTSYLNPCGSPIWSLPVSPHCIVECYITTSRSLLSICDAFSELLDKVLHFTIKKIFGVTKTPWSSWRHCSTILISKSRENFLDGLENSSPSQMSWTIVTVT